MERREQLQAVFEKVDKSRKTLINRVINEVVFLESRLDTLKTYPFISVCATNPNLQKQTAAGKQYKEILQQYSNCIKILLTVLYREKEGGTNELENLLKKYE